MKLQTIKIENLFGYDKNNYSINLMDEGNITFIYAYNGEGKSTVLKIIDAAINNTSFSIPFGKISLKFDTGEETTIQSAKNTKLPVDGLPNNLKSDYIANIYANPWSFCEDGSHFFDIQFVLKSKLNAYLSEAESDIKIVKEKIDFYLSLINSEYGLTDKVLNIKFSEDKKKVESIEFESAFKKGELHQLDFLSAGEKNFLYLYFNLVFTELNYIKEKDSNLLMLLDEPDSSMHPVWLVNFIDQLEEIKKHAIHKNVQYIITTHSPSITFNHSFLMTEMKRISGTNE